jgi:hypothetical protein
MRKVLAICGVFILFVGCGLGLFLLVSKFKAHSLDSPLAEDPWGCPNCAPPPPPPSCSAEALAFTEINASKVMSISESQKMTATLFNYGSEKCKISVTLDAPNFTISGEKRQIISIASLKRTDFNWVLSPEKPGTYTVIVSISTGNDAAEIIDSKDVGISVTNVFGLQASQASLLSILSAAFGPILTVPFWLDKWQKHKEKGIKLESRNED